MRDTLVQQFVPLIYKGASESDPEMQEAIARDIISIQEDTDLQRTLEESQSDIQLKDRNARKKDNAPSTSEMQREIIEPIGYRRHRVLGDGNCLFHSISASIRKNRNLQNRSFEFDPHNIETIRKRYIEKILLMEESDSRYQSILRMSSNAWAEDAEILYLSELLNLCIRVWDARDRVWQTYVRGSYDPQNEHLIDELCPTDDIIHIISDGHLHFDALIPICQ